MNVVFPIIELFDRYAIACVKWERTNANEDELMFYKDQIEQFDTKSVYQLIYELIDIHNAIWDLEWQLKTGVEDQLPLDEIGRRAIKIRNYNNQRITIKNKIAELLNDTVREIKQDHLSDNT